MCCKKPQNPYNYQQVQTVIIERKLLQLKYRVRQIYFFWNALSRRSLEGSLLVY